MSNILKDSYDEHFALIIGINEYDNLSNLEYAVKDAQSIKEVLIKNFNYKAENIKLLIDKQATHENIMDEYYNLIKITATNDSVLVFFAGHGSTYPSMDIDKGFLVPCDGTETRMNTLIGWERLINDSELIKAKHIFFIMDACYSGLALLRSNPSKRFLKDMVRRQSRQVLTAGKADQRVKDIGTQTKNSIFTGYLLKALNGEAKTKEGVICASSVMNYVYNNVANDPMSRQTPGCGSVLGEGDFIFNYEEIFSEENNPTKDNDILVEIDVGDRKYTVSEEDKLIDKLKELLADDKNYIKITDIVNNTLKIYLAKVATYKNDYSFNGNEEFVKKVEQYNKDIEILLKIVILLTYYGREIYSNLILKILSRIMPRDSSMSLLYYPVYLMYYVVIMSGLESKNYKVIKEIFELDIKRMFNRGIYDNDKKLIIETCNYMLEWSNNYKAFFPEKNYKYPLSEYLYKELQPLIDDFLYVGDEYPELFMHTEILISFLYAMTNYSEDQSQVWGPLGRYTYQMGYTNQQIEKFPINKVIEQLGLYTDLSNKADFTAKYNEFLSRHYF